ncbi:MAG: alpha/beta hydrolase, partial [Myxococcales bacterium]|nr:alpha/beta hydrolase [Myxococcales bacterium]
RYRGPARGRPPLADVWLPDGPGPHPSVVWVHGGGFAVGHRQMKPMRYLATACRRAGMAVLSFDYRLVFRGGRLDEAVDDVVAAVEWWASQGDAYRLDPRRVALGGLSAGGCLMLLAAPRLQDRLAAAVSVFSLYDIAGLDRGPARLLGRLAAGPDPALRRARSPVAAAPLHRPLLVLHGTDDSLVPVAQAQAYVAQRQAAGLPTTARIYPGEPHAFFNVPQAPIAARAAADVTAWLRERLA